MKIRSLFCLFGLLAVSACSQEQIEEPVNENNNTETPQPEQPSTPSYVLKFEEDVPVSQINHVGELTTDEAALAERIEHIGTRIFETLLKNDDKNVLFSPYSLEQYVAMATNAVDDDTQEALLATYGLDKGDIDVLNTLAGKMHNALEDDDEMATLEINNALWMDYRCPVYRSYANTLQNGYKAELNAIDCSSKEGAKTINQWISSKTRGCINDYLSEEPLLWNIALMNVVYFNASWRHFFLEEETSAKTFTNIDGTTSLVPTMHQRAYYDYAKNQYGEMMRMPLADDFEVVFVLPAGQDFDFSQMTEMLNSCKEEYIDLQLPKIKTNQRHTLSKALETNGFGALKGASLAKVSPADLHIAEVMQQVFLEFNEEGTQAAAVTSDLATSNGQERVDPEPINFHMNRPFYFVVRNKKCNATLFAGRINEL